MLNRLKDTYHSFPRLFWVVVMVSFIDRLGGNMLFPFFSLYITDHFNVGMTQAGFFLGTMSAFGLIGNMIGGGLTDKFGRKNIIIGGLIFSALSTLTLGLVDEFSLMIPLAVFIGLLSRLAGPAHQAMVADILPEEKRQEGFGILRVLANLTWIIGPIVGGFIANRSFFALFVIDAVVSCLVAFLVFLKIPETKPETGQEAESLFNTFKGYGTVIKDYAYIVFMVVSMLMLLVYLQMYNTLSVFLRDVHGISPQIYGVVMTSSAITVILFQFYTTRVIKNRPPFLMMALGTFFYMLGFGMFGFVATNWLFAMALVVITIGEMIVMPTSQALAANFAPEDMRGRYLALFGLAWSIPSIIGPSASGMILDNFNPFLIWYLDAGIAAVAVGGFYLLHLWLGKREMFRPRATSEVSA
ncbi:MAG TPA: MFS transporter [Chloroflexi bacterium]|nr:MFS transporter [Chloroflexota bacterium]